MDNAVKVWQAAPPPLRLLRGHTGPVTSMVISRDGSRLLSGTGGYDSAIRCWDAATGRQLKLFQQSGLVWNVKFLPDGHHVLSAGGGTSQGGKPSAGGEDFPIRVWALDG
jgi:WD40 repeat protein